jgi:molybdopterin-containing oxidoreductase family iron-sulfur binding subunit
MGRGVNPLKILDATTDSKTGELAMFSTPVSIEKIGDAETLGLVRMGSSDTQMGRKLVVTVPVEQVRRTEGV